MTPATREKILMAVFPPLLVVGVYGYFMSKGSELTAALTDLESVRASAAPPQAVGLARENLAGKQAEKTKLRTDKAQLEARWAAMSAMRNRPAAARTEALQRLSRMFEQLGLHTVEESPVEGSSGVLPAGLDEALRRLSGSQSSSASPRFWEVKFIGKYPDVQKLLDELAESDLPLIPISLNMSEAPVETDWRSWTLVVWM